MNQSRTRHRGQMGSKLAKKGREGLEKLQNWKRKRVKKLPKKEIRCRMRVYLHRGRMKSLMIWKRQRKDRKYDNEGYICEMTN